MSQPLLSILIPTITPRAHQLNRLLRLLFGQIPYGDTVEILTDPFEGPTGSKRNDLLRRSRGSYVCFIDDDDLVADDYVPKVLAACAQGADCCSLEGLVVNEKRASKPFHHSMRYPKWQEQPGLFVRTPNHLNAVKRELALEVGFPEVTVGEDHDYSRRLLPLLKSEAEVPGRIYWYFSTPKVRERAGRMRFLAKWPTRGRPKIFEQVLKQHALKLSGNNPVRWVVSVDEDDPTREEVKRILHDQQNAEVHVGPAGRGKIAAINADIPTDDSWDVLVLLADDMVPVEANWDERIVIDMARNFPSLDGLLVYDDGFSKPPADPQEVSVAVMPVMGRAFYNRFGYVYHPEYQSLWCDVELAEVAKKLGRVRRVPKVIIEHDWMGKKGKADELLRHNESFYGADRIVYDRRKTVGFPRGRSDVYSQNNEEDVILKEFGQEVGKLLDIGAYDGKTLSNSLKLIESGWSAVLVEPAPGPFQALLNRFAENGNVTLLNFAVAPRAGFEVFRDSNGDAVSTLSERHADMWSSAGVKWRQYVIKTVAVKELFAYVGWNFQFVNLDVEGMNLEVFKAISWDTLARSGLRMACIEHEGHQAEMEAVLKPLGFEIAAENQENVLFRKRR